MEPKQKSIWLSIAEKRWPSVVIHGDGQFAVRLCNSVRLMDDRRFALATATSPCFEYQRGKCDKYSHRGVYDLRDELRPAPAMPTPTVRTPVRIQFAESAREARRGGGE
jgi:hypothetical protein